MSSTSTSTVSTFSPSSSPNPPDGNGGMQRGANYFFGFLITFVALLLIFVGCGVGSRRRLAARRRGLLPGDLWSYEEIEQTEPTFLEPALIKGGNTWGEISPLSVSVSRQTTGDQEPQRSTSMTLTTPLRTPVRFPLSASAWLPGAKRKHTHEKEPDEGAPPETVQVAVMVAMPSRTDKYTLDKEGEHGPDEYEFGVARVPWGGGEMPT